MANLGEFGAAVREATRAELDTFTFFGEEFRVAGEVGAMPLMQFAHAASSGLDTADMEGAAAIHDLLQDILHEEDWPRFCEQAKSNKASAELLLELATELMSALAGRPTRRQSASSAGLSATTASSKVDSSSRAALGLVPVDELIDRAGRSA